jgi:hypothetical protein
MALLTEILLYRGALANMPLLPAGMPGFALDAGLLFVGNGTMNVPIGASGSGSVSSVSNSDGSLTISPTTGAIVASLNAANPNVFTAKQSIHAPSSAVALELKGDSTGTENLVEMYDDSGNLLTYVDSIGAIVFQDPADATRNVRMEFRDDPVGGGQAFYIDCILSDTHRCYIGSPGRRFYSLDLANLAAGIEGLALLNLSPTGDAIQIGSVGIIARADPAVKFGPLSYFSQMTFHAGASTALMVLDGSAATFALGVVFLPLQAPTASAPPYVKGGMYFDTTLNKLRIGGATAWETVTSV